jgi:hypothetical protein
MHIDLDEAIKIYAKASRSRYGFAARKKILATARALRDQGDQAGASIWERVAIEVDHLRAPTIYPPLPSSASRHL